MTPEEFRLTAVLPYGETHGRDGYNIGLGLVVLAQAVEKLANDLTAMYANELQLLEEIRKES